jgi:hypothetical protein
MSQAPSKPICEIVPLKNTTQNRLAGYSQAWMLWHLHANNVSATTPVTVEIHLGDTDKGAIDTLLISLKLPPNTSESIPLSLSQISFPAGSALYAKADGANLANVVINTEVL